jgi:16S rRNA G966 N2-methylase RsmD
MSTKANQSPENEEAQPESSCLANLQPLTWSFNVIEQRRTGFNVPPATERQMNARNEETLVKALQSSRSSPKLSHLHEKGENNMQDTEMVDVADTTSASFSYAATKRSPLVITSTPQEGPVIFLDTDEGFVEITAESRKSAGKEGYSTSHSQLPSRIIGNSPRLFPDRKSATGVSGGRSPWPSPTQPYREADQDEGETNGYISPTSSNEEPEIQILDPAIAKNFPAFKKFEIGPDDFLNEAAFVQWLNEGSVNTPLEINEDDGAIVEDFVAEDDIVDHLRSLVISQPGEPLLDTAQETSWVPQLVANNVKPKELDLHTGVTVELYNGSFLWIDTVREDFWGPVTIRGYRLVRDDYCGSRMPDGRTNELVWINEVDEEEHRAGLESVLHEIEASDVKRIREVIYTNCPWPKVSFKDDLRGIGRNAPTAAETKENGKLYCRWKYIQVSSRLKIDAEACLTLLKDQEAIGRGRLEASAVRKAWRGGREPIPGGSSTKRTWDVDTGKETSVPQYSLGDCFCGAGGISRGAIQAGLQVAWGFDDDKEAIEAHENNFQEHRTKSLRMNDAQFIDLIKKKPKEHRVDIAHYSPPCQPFSSANHNKNIERDYRNQKALFSLHHLTEVLKPRIATIEETAGLMHRHKRWFDTLINIFTSIGYSIRWKIVRCQDHGIPQTRVRLLLTAAA